jgi:DNA-binding transcriptional MerR regulator
MSLTKKDILEKLREDNVDLGKNPYRTLIFYQGQGLLPDAEGMRGKEALYPDSIVDTIKRIRVFQKEGDTLAEIKKFMDEGKKNIENRLTEIKKGRIMSIWNALNIGNSEAEEIFLEKYGDLVKRLAIQKFRENQEFLSSEDIADALMKK